MAPRKPLGTVRAAYDASTKANKLILPVDAALVAAGQKIADQIDTAVASFEGTDLTKALYLTPHLVNILRELRATPAARNTDGRAVPVEAKKERASGELGRLRSVQGGRAATARTARRGTSAG